MRPVEILQVFGPLLLAAGALGGLAWSLAGLGFARRRSAAEKAMSAFNAARRGQPREPGAPGPAPLGSQAYKISLAFAAAGCNVRGWERQALYLAYALTGLVLALPVLLLGLPFVLLLGSPFLGFVAVNALIDSRWQAVQMGFEREVPTLLSRLASLLKANPNLIESLGTVARGLDPGKPLQAWVVRLADELHGRGPAGLLAMQREAEGISPALLLAVIEIGRMWETGGGGYSEALRLTALNLSDLLETRSQAFAVGVGAWSAARTILLALGFTLAVVLVNPVSKAYFTTPLIQAALLLVMVWGGIGYWNIRDAIHDVME